MTSVLGNELSPGGVYAYSHPRLLGALEHDEVPCHDLSRFVPATASGLSVVASSRANSVNAHRAQGRHARAGVIMERNWRWVVGTWRWVVTLLLALLAPASWAQCSNAAKPSCDVYKQCFAKYCPCTGHKDDYFEAYGLTYCKSFLAAANFSEEGKKWRDKTLVCLQEAIIPKLRITDPPSECACSEMRAFAFDTHVNCYTQEGASICQLPLTDVFEVTRIIKIKDAMTPDGRKQTARVSQRCTTDAPDDERRLAWKAVYALLKQFE